VVTISGELQLNIENIKLTTDLGHAYIYIHIDVTRAHNIQRFGLMRMLEAKAYQKQQTTQLLA